MTWKIWLIILNKMADELDKRLVEITSILKNKSEKRIFILGYDKDENYHCIVHDYKTGEILAKSSILSEKLEKINRVTRLDEKLVSIVGENKAGNVFYMVHKYNNGDIIAEQTI